MLNKKYLLGFTLVILVFFSCGAPTTGATGKETESEAPGPNQPIFQWSTRLAPEIGQRTDNWCYSAYGGSQLINAEKINTNRRYFFLTQVSKLIAGPPGTTATLLLQPLDGGNVLVFTGTNFPECLSAPANLTLVAGGTGLRYNNHQNIDFQLDLQVEKGLPRITLEFPPGSNYAMSVNPCLECK